MNIQFKTIISKLRSQMARPRLDTFVRYERLVISGILGFGLILASLALLVQPSASGGGHEGHGGHEDSHGEEHEESAFPIVEIDDDGLEAGGIVLEQAAAVTLKPTKKLRGEITHNRDRFTDIAPRIPGTIQMVAAKLGQDVARGAVLAVVESTAARSAVEVRSGVAGTVVRRQAVPGAFASNEEPMFTVVDLSTVWVELAAPAADADALALKQKVTVRLNDSSLSAETELFYVSPSLDVDSQALIARAVIDNPDRAWRPGAFVEADISLGEKAASVAVKHEAVQILSEQTVLFVRKGDHFEARPVELGMRDQTFVEVLSGIDAGESYAAANSFVAKSELLKGSAGHDH